jgi:hypothetical protein
MNQSKSSPKDCQKTITKSISLSIPTNRFPLMNLSKKLTKSSAFLHNSSSTLSCLKLSNSNYKTEHTKSYQNCTSTLRLNSNKRFHSKNQSASTHFQLLSKAFFRRTTNSKVKWILWSINFIKSQTKSVLTKLAKP